MTRSRSCAGCSTSSRRACKKGKGHYQESKDFDFHFRIVTGSRNDRLAQMLCGDLYYLLRLYRYKSSTKPGRAMKALQEHKDIVAALARRDPVAAEQKMREHLRNARAFVEEQLAAATQDGPAPSAHPRPARKAGPLSTRRIGSLRSAAAERHR